MTKKIISNYADLLIKVGVNLQKKEKLVISAPVIAADLVRETVRERLRCFGTTSLFCGLIINTEA